MAFQVVEICKPCWGKRSDRTRLASFQSHLLSVVKKLERKTQKRWVLLWMTERRISLPPVLKPSRHIKHELSLLLLGKISLKNPNLTDSWWWTVWVSTEVMISRRVHLSLTQWHHRIGAVAVNGQFVQWNTPSQCSHMSSALRCTRAKWSHENRNPLVVGRPLLSSSPPLHCAYWCMALIAAQSCFCPVCRDTLPEHERATAPFYGVQSCVSQESKRKCSWMHD